LPYITTRVTTPQVAGHGNSSKNSVHAEVAERPGVQGWALKATSSRETRQLIVNHLYFICNLTLHYADTLNKAVTEDKTSQHHLASLAAAVVPN